jgi:TolB-like protein/DNA-binding winged helix-turn-helix (wHTH) protein/tetratricopeptide (TPR) repeat protein
LDTKRRALLVDGRPVELQSRPFDILECLVAGHDRVVTRDEIVAHVWHGYTVAENNLTVQISTLRRALAEHGGGDLIITVPGKGYRFVGDIEPEPTEPVTTLKSTPPMAPEPREAPTLLEPAATPRYPVRRRTIVAALAILLLAGAGAIALRFADTPAAPRLSIAVLPFRNLSPDRSQDYLADAISDDLTTDLAHIPGSTVIARESADYYRNRTVPMPQIGRELRVRYLLEGHITVEGRLLGINSQLIDAASNTHIWSDRRELKLVDIASARNTIVRSIASALDATLTEREGAPTAGRPDNPDALTLFYRARSAIDRDDTLAGYAAAQHLLEQAVRQSPGFADAWAQLGLTLILKIRSTDDPDDTLDETNARAAITRALQLQPRNATALAADARLQESHGNCQSATVSANAALAVEPNSIDALYIRARCALMAGDLDAAADNDLETLRLNPAGRTNKPRYVLLAEVRLLQGKYQDAINYAYQAMDGDADPAPGANSMDRANFCRLLLIAATALNGDIARAQTMYAEYKKIWPYHTTWRIGAYASRKVASLPGYVRFLQALHAAGMPRFADEHADYHVPPPPGPVPNSQEFDPTPLAIPGATTIDTAQLTKLIASAHPLVIDLGRGAGVIEGAQWDSRIGPDVEDNSFIDHALDTLVLGDLGKSVVVMATGPFRFNSYNGALHVAQRGYHHVYWYRGGEEAWAAAGNAALDLRQ